MPIKDRESKMYTPFERKLSEWTACGQAAIGGYTGGVAGAAAGEGLFIKDHAY
jgi:hypothetical protein